MESDPLGVRPVIRIVEGDIFSRRNVHEIILRDECPLAARAEEDFDAGILRLPRLRSTGVASELASSTIEQFDISMRLPQIDSTAKSRLPRVVGRHDHTDERPAENVLLGRRVAK